MANCSLPKPTGISHLCLQDSWAFVTTRMHFLHTGTIWVHGPSVEVPTTGYRPRYESVSWLIEKGSVQVDACLHAQPVSTLAGAVDTSPEALHCKK